MNFKLTRANVKEKKKGPRRPPNGTLEVFDAIYNGALNSPKLYNSNEEAFTLTTCFRPVNYFSFFPEHY